MKLHRLLGLEEKRLRVALVGGGGKTTAMQALAREAAAAGMKSALLTTTHIFPPEGQGFALILDDDPNAVREAWSRGLVAVAGRMAPDGRLLRPGDDLWRFLLEEAQAVYVEADGSRGLPLKYPAPHEPALPTEAEQILLLCGLSALDKPLYQACHRWELLREGTGPGREMLGEKPDGEKLDGERIDGERIIDEELMARVLAAGYAKYQPLVVINQADTPELRRRGYRLSALLAEHELTRSVVISLHNFLADSKCVE